MRTCADMKLKLALMLAACTASGVAQAAKVTDVNAKKKLVAIELDDGKTYEVDTEICFFSDSAKKIDCGTISKIKGTKATVKMKSAKRMKRIKPDMDAHPIDQATADGAKTDEAPAKGGKASNKKTPFRVWLLYSPGLATPAKFNKLGYAAPTTEAPETLWKADAAVATALFGFNLQLGIPLGNYSLNPGFRYRSFTPSLIDADYFPQKENPYASTEQKATAIGLFFDFQFMRVPMLTNSAFWVASGLDFDASTVTLTATKKDDTGTIAESEIAHATSKLTVASLRVSSGLDLVFAKPLGAFFGITLMIPLAEFGASFNGDLGDSESRNQADPGEDLKKSLGHKKNSVAYEISLGGVLAF